MRKRLRLWIRNLVYRVASSPKGAAIFKPILSKIDRRLIDWTGGRHSISSLLTGLDSLVLTTVGVRSGRSHSVPLLYLRDQDKIVLIASNWGNRKNPAWYYNLRANPSASISLNGWEGNYIAREAVQSERERYWSLALAMYPGYEAYQTWTRGRVIPIMVLTPQ